MRWAGCGALSERSLSASLLLPPQVPLLVFQAERFLRRKCEVGRGSRDGPCRGGLRKHRLLDDFLLLDPPGRKEQLAEREERVDEAEELLTLLVVRGDKGRDERVRQMRWDGVFLAHRFGARVDVNLLPLALRRC